MKYKDTSTNTFKPIYVKALDSMPVGTEVDFDGQAVDIPVGWEQVDDKGEVYSTDEVRVGTWIDGKPIYRKVVELLIPNTDHDSWVNIDHNISNIGDICTCTGILKRTNASSVYLPFYQSSQYFLVINASTTNIGYQNKYFYGTAYVTLEYTKTTDIGGNA